MTPQQIISADYLDIVFEGRNKAYGAFALRKGERSRQFYAILFLVLPFTILFLLQRYLQSTVKTEPKIVTIFNQPDPEDFVFEQPQEQQAPAGDPKPSEPSGGGASTAATLPEIVDNTELDTSTAPSEVPVKTPGDNESEKPGPGTDDEQGGDGGGKDKPGGGVGRVLVPDAVERILDVQPAFNGDMQDWLRNAIRYPQQEAEDGVDGRVILQFIVERDGAVNAVEVVRTSGSVPLDKEAIRVVRSMPRWQPGIAGGKPVRAYFSIPITFSIR